MAENKPHRSFSNLFAASASFTDPRRSQAFSSLYSLMRIVDEMADQLIENPEMPSEAKKEIEDGIKHWQKQIGYCYERNRDTSRIDLALLKAVAMFQIPSKLWNEFFQAMTLPIKVQGFETLDELYAYSLGAAAAPMTVFLLICFAERETDGTYRVTEQEKIFSVGESLGIWSFIIHILSVAKLHLTEKTTARNLFPLELMNTHGITLENLIEMARAGCSDERCRAMVKDCLNLAADHGRLGLGYTRNRCLKLSKDCCSALAIPLALYHAFARHVIENNFEIFDGFNSFEPGDRLSVISRITECQSADELKTLW